MRVVPCLLALACCCAALTGCGLFRNQSAADPKRPSNPVAQNQNKQLSAVAKDDPYFEGAAGSDQLTLLSGVILDSAGSPMGGAYVRLTCLDDAGTKEAPIDLAVQPDGTFVFQNVKSGKRYKLEGRANQEGKLVAGTYFTTAPNHCHFKLTAKNVTADTPPLPPPPGDALKPKPKPPEVNPDKDKGTKSPTGFAPGPKNGLSIGLPVPVPEKPGNDSPSGWAPAATPNAPPKYPQGIAGVDQVKAPVIAIPPGQSAPAKDAPYVAPAQSKDPAHVPSCVIIGKQVKNFALPDVAGNPWEFQANRLGKLVLLDFWRTNCPPCRDAMYHLRMLQAAHGPAGLQVVGIAAENHGTLTEQRENIARLCQLKQTNYQILMATGANDPVMNSFAITALPTLILLDHDGNILYRSSGMEPAAWQALEQYIQNYLSK